MRAILTVVIVGGCAHRALAPGETQCTTTHAFGVDSTHCQTGQAPPPIAPPAPSQIEVEERQERPTPTGPRKIIEGDGPVFCMADAKFGPCFMDELTCGKFHDKHPDAAPCAEASGAACFNSTSVVTGQRSPVCFSKVSACEEVLAAERTSADVTDLSSRCGIYRRRSTE